MIKKILHNRRGFTLVEAIVAIGLFSVLVTIAVGGFVTALHTQHQVGDLISAQSTVSLAIEQMAREIRTGYLFCHAPDLSTPNVDCGCRVGTDSSGMPVWACSQLDFLNANSASTTYFLTANGTLMRSNVNESGGTPAALTGDNVTVKYLIFTLRGNIEGDGWPPLVTISLGVAPSSTDPAITGTVLHFQTSVSARQIDCTTGHSC